VELWREGSRGRGYAGYPHHPSSVAGLDAQSLPELPVRHGTWDVGLPPEQPSGDGAGGASAESADLKRSRQRREGRTPETLESGGVRLGGTARGRRGRAHGPRHRLPRLRQPPLAAAERGRDVPRLDPRPPNARGACCAARPDAERHGRPGDRVRAQQRGMGESMRAG
jgi:hypothetical protein